MNKIYKLVWSKVKNCYVVVSELAKSHTKSPKSGIMSRSLVAGVLASICCVVASELAKSKRKTSKGCKFNRILETGFLACIISGSIILPSEAMVSNGTYNFYTVYSTNSDNGGGQTIYNYGLAYNPSNNTLYTASYWYDSSSPEPAYWGNVQLDGPIAVGSSVTRDQIISASGTTFSAIAGTNVTVNADGISVTGNGSVASGDSGLIDGDKLYAEVRPSANGNYVIQLELYNFISSFPLFCSFLTIP